MKDLPILGAHDHAPDYMSMPHGMNVYRAPVLPERESARECAATRGVLCELRTALHAAERGERPTPIALEVLPAADRQLLAEVLGEGEVSAHLHMASGLELRVQEAVFAGVWRILELDGDAVRSDRLEVGALPDALLAQAVCDGQVQGAARYEAPEPDGLMNAPAIVHELACHWRSAEPPRGAHVINLTLLPLSAADEVWLDAALGSGRVTLLSRGYGNCRISSTLRPHTWRVIYYNSEDRVILNTIEISRIPEVACAATRDLADSAQRLSEVMAWLEEP
jgi:hydrogenase-1 operon protein HyaF